MRGCERLNVNVSKLVALQLDPGEVGEAFEGARRDPLDLVVVQVDVLQPGEQGVLPKLLDLVEAGAEDL